MRKKVGYYAGLMDGISRLASLITVMFWSRMSDHIGRKPILLLGMLALAISNLSFGLSRTFWALIVSRSIIFPGFNSNKGVEKSIVSEITDQTNRADGFAIVHVAREVGNSFGKLLGGWLSRPHDHFPDMFPSRFWINYPCFLPYAILAIISVIGFIVVAVHLNETVGGGYFGHVTTLRKRGDDDVSEPLLGSSRPSGSGIQTTDVNEEPVPLKDLLNIKVLIPVINYTYLCSLEAASNGIQPLFLAMPVNNGGLGLRPREIGYILGTYDLLNGIFQLVMFGRLIRRFGVKDVFLAAISAPILIFALSPVLNLIVRRNGFSYIFWVALCCQLSAYAVMGLGNGCMYMYLAAVSPNKRSLGATYGLAMTLDSIGRMVMSPMASSLLAFSIQHQIFWGFGVYVVLIFFTIGGIGLAFKLPRKLDS